MMIYGNAKEEWDALSINEQVALREACLRPQVSIGWTADGGFVGSETLESLCDKDFLAPEINGSCCATEDGRAVYESGQAATPEDADALGKAQARIAELEADTDAAARSLTTALMQAVDKVTELRAVLKATRDHIETFRNKVGMPPSVYVALTDMTLRIDEALEAHKQERANDALGEGE